MKSVDLLPKNSNVDLANQSIWATYTPKSSLVQKGCLVASVALTALSLIPPLRLAGSLALRSVALLSSTQDCKSRWDSPDTLSKVTSVARTAIVGIGLVGIAASLPILSVASLVADAGLHIIGIVKAVRDEDPDRFAMHLGGFMIDAFAAGGIAAGSWPLMVTACSISALVMGGAAIRAGIREDGSGVEVLSYIALSGLSIAAAISIAEIGYNTVTDEWFEYRNRSAHDIKLVDSNGDEVCIIESGKTARLSIDVAYHKDIRVYGGGGDTMPVVVTHKYLNGLVLNEDGVAFDSTRAFIHDRNTKVWTSLHRCIAPEQLPTVPVGGTHHVGKDITTLKGLGTA